MDLLQYINFNTTYYFDVLTCHVCECELRSLEMTTFMWAARRAMSAVRWKYNFFSKSSNHIIFCFMLVFVPRIWQGMIDLCLYFGCKLWLCPGSLFGPNILRDSPLNKRTVRTITTQPSHSKEKICALFTPNYIQNLNCSSRKAHSRLQENRVCS